jgi:glutathionyl-hydroquinone reductase
MQKITPQAHKSWINAWYDTSQSDGRFIRKESLFRNWITHDGSPGPTGVGGFRAEANRYHLYISMACPWAHRALLTRKLKNLEGVISISNTLPYMGPLSWSFVSEQGRLFMHPDPEQDCYVEYLYELYQLVDPDYDSRATVPVLWDKKQQTIVSNESAEIVRMLNSEFAALGASELNLYPAHLQKQIDELNELLYPTVNNGVYRAGFATTQVAYEEAVWPLFATLDQMEARLEKQRFLCGADLTEADLRLFPTLVRFDAVYAGHFKCNLRRLVDYPNLWAYTRDIFQLPGICETVDIQYNKQHYYGSHPTVNPTGVIPVGPLLDFNAPHNRKRLN